MVIYDSLTIVVTYITDHDTDLKLCRVDIKILQLEYDKFTMTTTRPRPQTVFVIKTQFIC